MHVVFTYRLAKRGKVHVEDKIVSRKHAPAGGEAAMHLEQPSSGLQRDKQSSGLQRDKKRRQTVEETSDQPGINESKKVREDKKASRTESRAASKPEAVESAAPSEAATAAVGASDSSGAASTSYPPSLPRKGNVSLLLFYAYCVPPMTKGDFHRRFH